VAVVAAAAVVAVVAVVAVQSNAGKGAAAPGAETRRVRPRVGARGEAASVLVGNPNTFPGAGWAPSEWLVLGPDHAVDPHPIAVAFGVSEKSCWLPYPTLFRGIGLTPDVASIGTSSSSKATSLRIIFLSPFSVSPHDLGSRSARSLACLQTARSFGYAQHSRATARVEPRCGGL
jgi:hypothetical protein